MTRWSFVHAAMVALCLSLTCSLGMSAQIPDTTLPVIEPPALEIPSVDIPEPSIDVQLPSVDIPSLEVPTPSFEISGSLTVTSDIYSHNANPSGAQPGRRPPSLHRIVFTPVFKFGNHITFPLNLRLASVETNVMTPSIPSPTIGQFLQNPANAFGLSSFTPSIGWAGFSLGSHTPTFSELTVGDLQVFGLGTDLKPGVFRIAGSYGITQRAVEPDTERGIAGAYERRMRMARFAIGHDTTLRIGVNYVHAQDNPSSITNNVSFIRAARPLEEDSSIIIPADTLRLHAEEGTVISADAEMPFSKVLKLKLEGALSAFTGNTLGPVFVIDGNPIDALQTTHTSTRADFAVRAEVVLKEETWGGRLYGLYMGAGYVPIGYAFAQSDRFEMRAESNFRLFDNALSFTGSIGSRTNNLSGTKGETQSQLLASTNISVDVTEWFNLGVQYSNFGIRNSQTLDTLRVQNVSQSLSIDPSITIATEDVTHIFTTSIALDDYHDYNTISGAETSNDTRIVLAAYNAAILPLELSAGVLASYIENRLSIGALVIRSLGVTAEYALLEGMLKARAGITASSNTLVDGATDSQTTVLVGLAITPFKNIELKATATNNGFRYGDAGLYGSAYDEMLIQFSLTTRL